MKINTPTLVLLAFGVACLSFSATATNVTSWRNETGGKFLDANPPTEWTENIAWSTPLESTSNASPILVDGKLFFTSEPANLICADSETGEILWTQPNSYLDLMNLTDEELQAAEDGAAQAHIIGVEIGRVWNDWRRIRQTAERGGTLEDADVIARLKAKEDEAEELEEQRRELMNDPKVGKAIIPPTHGSNGFSSYSPISDGERVYVSFGLGVVVAYDLDGNRLWYQVLEKPDHSWGGSTMPVLVDGKLIVRFSDYVALNPETGEEIWRTPSDVVFGTPTPFQVEHQTFLFTPRGEVIRASDGRIMQSGLVRLHAVHPWSAFNTPVLEGDTLYTIRGFVYEGAEGFASAFRIPQDLKTMETTGLEVLWRTDVFNDRYYASSIVHDGLMYSLSRNYAFTVLEADTGKLVYEKQIEGLRETAYSSLSLAGDHLIFGSETGTIVVVKTGRTYEEISRNDVGPFRSTPIFKGDVAYLRTFENLQAFRAN